MSTHSQGNLNETIEAMLISTLSHLPEKDGTTQNVTEDNLQCGREEKGEKITATTGMGHVSCKFRAAGTSTELYSFSLQEQ